MTTFKIVPVEVPNANNIAQLIKLVGIRGKIQFAEVGDSNTEHLYSVQILKEVVKIVDDVEVPEIQVFTETDLKTTQAVTAALMNPATQYAAVLALATQYGYELLPENQQ